MLINIFFAKQFIQFIKRDKKQYSRQIITYLMLINI